MILNRYQKAIVLLLAGACTSIGCGEAHQKRVVPVSGIVSVDGEPVTEGYIIFTPVVSSESDSLNSGKSASGTLDAIVSFKLTTYNKEDGAMVGKHLVHFYKPDPEDDEQYVDDPFLPGGKEVEMEVMEGSNWFEIELNSKGDSKVTWSKI